MEVHAGKLPLAILSEAVGEGLAVLTPDSVNTTGLQLTDGALCDHKVGHLSTTPHQGPVSLIYCIADDSLNRCGSVTVASSPPPWRFWRCRPPPCALAIRSTMDKPSPAPSGVLREAPSRANGLTRLLGSVETIPGPRSNTAKMSLSLSRRV